jgi:peptidoglycan DL-endopeptidase CwlO
VWCKQLLILSKRFVAAAAILYAAEQLGKPYLWGGTGPDAFDCSGLVMMAYRAAGTATSSTAIVRATAAASIVTRVVPAIPVVCVAPASPGTPLPRPATHGAIPHA